MRIDSDHRSTVPPSDVLGLKSHGWDRYPCAQFHNYQSSAVGEKLCYPLLVALRLAHRSIPDPLVITKHQNVWPCNFSTMTTMRKRLLCDEFILIHHHLRV